MPSLSSIADRLLHPLRPSHEPRVSFPAASAAKMDRALEVLHGQFRESGFVEDKGLLNGYIAALNQVDNRFGNPAIDITTVNGWSEARSIGKPPAEGMEDERRYDFVVVLRPNQKMIEPSEVMVIVGNKDWRVDAMLGRYQTTLDRMLAEHPDWKTRNSVLCEVPSFDREAIMEKLDVTTANRPAPEVNGRDKRLGNGEQ